MATEKKEGFEEFDDLEVSRNSLTILITGILVIVAGFVTYNFFADRAAQSPKPDQDIPIEQLQQQLNQDASNPNLNDGELAQPEIGGISGSSTEKDTELLGTGGPVPGVETLQSAWTANYMAPNTLSGDRYQVKDGDTLWEIAQARYGSGFEWTKLLDANKDTVDFLANGSQALIIPGQVLVLPN